MPGAARSQTTRPVALQELGGAAQQPDAGRRRCRCCRRRAARCPSCPHPASGRRRCAAAPAHRGDASARRPRARCRRRGRRDRAGPGGRSSGPGRSRCRGSRRGSGPSSSAVGAAGRPEPVVDGHDLGPVVRARSRARCTGSPRRASLKTSLNESRPAPRRRPRPSSDSAALIASSWRTGSPARRQRPSSASATSSTSRRVTMSVTRAPARSAPRRVSSPVRAVDMGTSCEVRRAGAVHPPRGATSHRRTPGRGLPRRGRSAARRPRPARAAWRCGVSMPTWTTGAPEKAAASRCALTSRSAKSSPRWGWTVQSAVASSSSSARCAVGQDAVEGEVTAVDAVRRRARGHGVQQCRGGEVGRALHPDLTSEPGLDPAEDGRLGDDESDRRPHESTRAKSRAARMVPSTEPETLDLVPAARG